LKRESGGKHEKGVKRGAKITPAMKAEATAEPPRLHGIADALDQAVHLTPVGETLFIVPTYTGLLELHHELERRGLTPHFWEG
jgi:hypothetical protein